jgi:hypothetical protein
LPEEKIDELVAGGLDRLGASMGLQIKVVVAWHARPVRGGGTLVTAGGAQEQCPVAPGSGHRGSERRGIYIDSIAVEKGWIQASVRGIPFHVMDYGPCQNKLL